MLYNNIKYVVSLSDILLMQDATVTLEFNGTNLYLIKYIYVLTTQQKDLYTDNFETKYYSKYILDDIW